MSTATVSHVSTTRVRLRSNPPAVLRCAGGSTTAPAPSPAAFRPRGAPTPWASSWLTCSTPFCRYHPVRRGDLLWQRSLVVCSTDEQPEKGSLLPAPAARASRRWRASSLPPAPTCPSMPNFQHHIPAVFIDRRPPQPWGPTVETDNVRAGYAATRYLLGPRLHPHRHPGPPPGTSVDGDRSHVCYRQALAEADITPDPSLAVTVDRASGSSLEGTLALLAQPRTCPPAFIAATTS